jgi:hypothetical protein
MTRRSNPTRGTKPPERGSIQDAVSILGKHERTIRAMAGRGELPGAARIGGTWTFNLESLRAYVSSKELEVWQSARPQRAVSGGAKCSGAGYPHELATPLKQLAAAGKPLKEFFTVSVWDLDRAPQNVDCSIQNRMQFKASLDRAGLLSVPK